MADTPVPPTDVDSLPTTPNRLTQTPPVFEANALAWSTALVPFTTQMNTLAANVLFNSESAFDSASEAFASAASAASSASGAADSASVANFVGDWPTADDGSSSGALTKPASTRHDNRIWLLLNNLADVSASEPGVTADWATFPQQVREERTSNTIFDVVDLGKIIDYTTGGFTQTFADVANLKTGWYIYVKNNSADAVTLDPFGSQPIDGLTSFKCYPGELRLIMVNSDATGFDSIVFNGFTVTITASESFTVVPGYKDFDIEAWSGGSSGQRNNNSAANSYGGGGGGYARVTIPCSAMASSETITIGAGGAAVTTVADGNVGGATSFGSHLTVNGSPSADFQSGGSVIQDLTSSSPEGFAGALSQATPVTGVYGGGASSSDATAASSGGHWGGAAGGCAVAGGTLQAAGTSVYGGDGGAASSASNGTDGTVPGGGGGATHTGTQSGAGGDGQMIIRGVI